MDKEKISLKRDAMTLAIRFNEVSDSVNKDEDVVDLIETAKMILEWMIKDYG